MTKGWGGGQNQQNLEMNILRSRERKGEKKNPLKSAVTNLSNMMELSYFDYSGKTSVYMLTFSCVWFKGNRYIRFTCKPGSIHVTVHGIIDL